MPGQVILEGWRNHHDLVGSAIEKARDLSETSMQQRILRPHTDGAQRLRPKIADFKDERYTLPECNPPAGKPDQQLWGSRDHHVWTGDFHPAPRGRYAKRSVVQHALVRLAIREGQ